MQHIKNIIPSGLVIKLLFMLFPKYNNSIVANIVTRFSIFSVSFWNFKGLIIEHIPKIKNKFAILLPTTFPIDISECPSIAAVVLTINSGIDVPIATIVSPIIIVGILNFFASPLAPSTKKSAPFINKKNPIIINTMYKIIWNPFSKLILFLYIMFYVHFKFI